MKSVPHATCGGGLAVIFRTSLKSSATVINTFAFEYSPLELLELTLFLQHIQFHFFRLYRPPPSNKKTHLSDALFLEQFPDFLSYCNTLRGKMLVLGDFNFQYDCDHKMSHMRDILTQFDLGQFVRDPTHKSGHVIDWVFQRQREPMLHSVSIEFVLTSDHTSIVCTKNVFKPKCPPTVMFRRKLKGMNTDAFQADPSQILTYHPHMILSLIHI